MDSIQDFKDSQLQNVKNVIAPLKEPKIADQH